MATVGTSITSARILVVEDEPIIALDLERTFVDAGAYVVGPAYTLFEALEFARKEAIDVAILDVRLGGENSRDVARILASRGVPILI